jgi:hypothetical protein
MGKIKDHPDVKLVVGFIYSEDDAQRAAESFLCDKFGKVDHQSPVLIFDKTDYYRDEIGGGLKRKFISFQKLIPTNGIEDVKVYTNSIEDRLSYNNKRTVNLDPGYITDSKLVLFTTKDHQHRIYLNNGIYAEVTLRFQDKTFKPWEWTYPDYRTDEYIIFFNEVRNDLRVFA